MDRLFLDANVLFSAAYREDSGLVRLWELGDVELVTSAYAFEEARRNLGTENQRSRLQQLLRTVRLVPESALELPSDVKVSEKDVPILQAAIAAESTHLITGDRRDFGRYFGKEIAGISIVTPRAYLDAKQARST